MTLPADKIDWREQSEYPWSLNDLCVLAVLMCGSIPAFYDRVFPILSAIPI